MAAIVSKLAAIVCAPDDAHGASVDALVLEFCQGLQRQGWQVGGVTQRHQAGRPADAKPLLELIDLRSGAVYPISQDLGRASRACCIDPTGVAQASGVLRQALSDGVQLAVTNRFGELEATGGGFAAEMAALVEAGIPVLTVVAHRHLDAWRRYTGGLGDELPARTAALHSWFTLASSPQEVL